MLFRSTFFMYTQSVYGKYLIKLTRQIYYRSTCEYRSPRLCYSDTKWLTVILQHECHWPQRLPLISVLTTQPPSYNRALKSHTLAVKLAFQPLLTLLRNPLYFALGMQWVCVFAQEVTYFYSCRQNVTSL